MEMNKNLRFKLEKLKTQKRIQEIAIKKLNMIYPKEVYYLFTSKNKEDKLLSFKKE
jgi:cell division protein FtsB